MESSIQTYKASRFKLPRYAELEKYIRKQIKMSILKKRLVKLSEGNSLKLKKTAKFSLCTAWHRICKKTLNHKI